MNAGPIKKILLCPVGSRGDVEPMLVLADELAARGHRVSFAAPPNFRRRVESAGFVFRALGSDTDSVLREHAALSERNQLLAMPRQIALISRETERQCHDLLQAPPSADLVVGAGLAFAPRLLAEQQHARYSFVCYTLSAVASRAHPPASLPIFRLPPLGNRALWRIATSAFDLSVGKVLSRVRRTYGLRADPQPWRSIHAEQMILAQDELFGRLPADALGCAAHVAALSRAAGAAPLPEHVTRFLGEVPGAPLVYVGFGSMPSASREGVVKSVVEFCKVRGARALLYSGHGEDAGFELPASVLSVATLDHAQLFPQLDLVVHHGGAGTTATALRAGVPQFIVPHIVDQFFHGRRIAELGLGPAPAKKRDFGARLLDLPFAELRAQRERARTVAASLTPSGAPQAADYLESLLRDALQA